MAKAFGEIEASGEAVTRIRTGLTGAVALGAYANMIANLIGEAAAAAPIDLGVASE